MGHSPSTTMPVPMADSGSHRRPFPAKPPMSVTALVALLLLRHRSRVLLKMALEVTGRRPLTATLGRSTRSGNTSEMRDNSTSPYNTLGGGIDETAGHHRRAGLRAVPEPPGSTATFMRLRCWTQGNGIRTAVAFSSRSLLVAYLDMLRRGEPTGRFANCVL